VCADLQVKLEQAATELSAANQKVDVLSNDLSELQATIEQVVYI
jgi:multidrug resistance efflux pump